MFVGFVVLLKYLNLGNILVKKRKEICFIKTSKKRKKLPKKSSDFLEIVCFPENVNKPQRVFFCFFQTKVQLNFVINCNYISNFQMDYNVNTEHHVWLLA